MPLLVAAAKGRRIRIDKPDEYFSYDPATDRAETMTTRADVGFAQDVIPERRIPSPTRRSDAYCVCGEWIYPQMTRHYLTRW